MSNNIILIKERQKVERNKKIIFFAVMMIAIIILITFFSSTVIMARSKSLEKEYKYFKSIEIEEGDTLWAIAKEYMSPEHYDSVDDYINEIKVTNGITEDNITAGNHLIVTYYSDEIK